MILDLDDERSSDPSIAGAKAAGLARARRVGLPALPGIVVAADASEPSMALGTETLAVRGSGGARSAIMSLPLDEALSKALAAAATPLGEPLIVRSSSVLEGDGAWSGAFTSYLQLERAELDAAVRGCWASAFTLASLARAGAAGLGPRVAPMAVIIQPSIEPSFGGLARLEGTGVVVIGVAGSPAPLLGGWDPGVVATVADDGSVHGDRAIELLGRRLIGDVAATLREANRRLGSTACEWACRDDDRVVLLQVSDTPARSSPAVIVPPALRWPTATRLAHLARRSPGPLGEALILPWAVGEPESTPGPVRSADMDPLTALGLAIEGAKHLSQSVWRTRDPEASGRARDVLRATRGTHPERALTSLDHLAVPDPGRATEVRSLVARVRDGLVEAGEITHAEAGWYVDADRAAAVLAGTRPAGRSRIGIDRWEPFGGAVVLGVGRTNQGIGAAGGLGYGRFCFVRDPGRGEHIRPRDVIVTTHPVPGFGALLWDAAAIVTTGGGPAAHLFESARSLGIPAVCGARLEDIVGPLESATGRFAVAVDGDAGVIALTEW